MKKISAGKKLFLSVTGIFLLFAVAFIVFQHQRERQYKMDSITQSLQSYNVAMAGTLRMLGKWDETTLTRYIKGHPMEGLRVTVIRKDGKVIFDSEEKDYANFTSHANRPEILEA
ncbi:MAG TPA: histidine kinase, partial [Candidatus Prevotella avicola]|nr:histidine kinase [Candidatus Prevotella avicola]